SLSVSAPRTAQPGRFSIPGRLIYCPCLSLLIAGHWRNRESRDVRPVINPATGSRATADAVPEGVEAEVLTVSHFMLTALETPFCG
ncbi:MAG TPA: hypothetical protein VF482_04030, partial [Trebonia sp.]